ncbi:MAG: hypothetical protein ACJ75R_07275 [Solirubrobacterales bacterium]
MESIHYHLELTPEQLKITHTALRSLLDDFGHDETKIVDLIREVLAKLPDEHAIRAIRIADEVEADVEAEAGAEPGPDAAPPRPTRLHDPPTGGGSPSAA